MTLMPAKSERVRFAMAAKAIAMSARFGQLTSAKVADFAATAIMFAPDELRKPAADFVRSYRRDQQLAGADLDLAVNTWIEAAEVGAVPAAVPAEYAWQGRKDLQ